MNKDLAVDICADKSINYVIKAWALVFANVNYL